MVKGCVENAANPAVKATGSDIIRVYLHAKAPKIVAFVKVRLLLISAVTCFSNPFILSGGEHYVNNLMFYEWRPASMAPSNNGKIA